MAAEAALGMDDAFPRKDQEQASEAAHETTSSHGKGTRWEVVAVANGLAQASIIQGRLESEGIPTRVHQEPAGVAIGLTVGPLGQAEILVPESMAEEALLILEPPGRDTGETVDPQSR